MKDAIVILCEAGCKFLVDKCTRLMPTSMEEWMRIDATIREVMARTEIGYTVLPKEMDDLARKFVVAAARLHAGLGR